MKKIKPKDYSKLKPGKTYLFASIHFKEKEVSLQGKKVKTWEIVEVTPREGKLLSITTKRIEILKKGKPTGKFALVGDVLIFEPRNNCIVLMGSKVKVFKTVIGCNNFKIYKK